MAGHIKYVNHKQRKRVRRKIAIRLRMSGTAERPRLSVFRSARYVYAQAVDDTTGRVLACASELEATLKTELAGKKKKERARQVGKAIGTKLVALNIKAVVFDRNGYIYHGRVKEIADGARDAGLVF
ncbi:MAG TPA: 50S ribosomal protein L18 [Kofleriaceae bacterium]|jgi:large subunit ribosomal protein L18|nr:50S ribosomal protein L18 [Kofleriaceae bacterium]